MKSDLKDLEKPVVKSLGRVLNQTEEIKESVKDAASNLASVNEVLKQEKKPTFLFRLLKMLLFRTKRLNIKWQKPQVIWLKFILNSPKK